MSDYSTNTVPIENGKGRWNYLTVSIWEGGVPIGSYVRNYHNLYETFYPFTKDGKDYALYSPKYTVTRVMALPSCEDIGGEVDETGGGFCPTEYYVPPEAKGQYGFVAGCHWGDDTSWKIQFLDLREVEQGVVKRDDRFGYIELPNSLTLAKAIEVWDDEEDDHLLSIAVQKRFRVSGGECD